MTRLLLMPWYVRPELVQRVRQVASVLARHELGWLAGQFGMRIPHRQGQAARFAQPQLKQAQHLRQAMGELGGAFIKIGQLLSLRRDILPVAFTEELAKLQDAAPTVTYEQICQVIAEEMHRLPGELFATFEETPLASASIAQVHRAVLKTGKIVAIKVQRPEIAATIQQDLEILTGMSEWAEAHSTLARTWHVRQLIDEFAYQLRAELDFEREGRNMEKIRQNLLEDAGLHVPLVHWSFTSKRVLTLDFVQGIRATDIDALRTANINRHAVAANAIRLALRMIFEFGFFHADPHPGNFFVQADGSITLIDFGIVGRVSDALQDRLLRFALALTRGDAARLADELCDLCSCGNVDTNQLALDLSHLLDQISGLSMKELTAGPIIVDLFGIVRRHRLWLPAEMVALLRLISISEGIGLQIDPDFRILDFAAPYIKQFQRQRFSPDKIAKRFTQMALDMGDLGAALPLRVNQLLSRIERGDLRVTVDDLEVRELMHQMQHMINRLAMTMILAATLVALGLAVVAYRPAEWESYASVVVMVIFPCTLLLGAALMWSIWRSNRN